MAAITYGTRYSNAAGDSEGLPIKRLWHEEVKTGTSWVNHVYVQLFGKNTEFKVGQVVTIETPTDTFTGKIWYIYNAPEVYNIYVHPSTKTSAEIKDATSGTAWLGSIAHPEAGTGQTVLQTIVESEETKEVLSKSEVKDESVANNSTKKYMITGAVVLALIAIVTIYKKLKK